MEKVNGLRQLIQTNLSTIANLDCGVPIGDDLIQEDVYYFGYSLNLTGTRYNLDYSDLRQTITLSGYLSTRGGSLADFDGLVDDIMNELANLRFLCTMQHINTLDTEVKKVLITGTVYYNYLDGLLK